jgi:uncharacterized protein (TIGR02285 family)
LAFPFFGISFADSGLQNKPENIMWYRAYFPPVTIPSGPDAGLGFFDKVTDLLIQQLPEYDHSHKVANFKRIIVDIKRERNVCCPSLYKTKERDQFVSFSIPAFVVLPNMIITKKVQSKKLKSYIDENNKLKLSELLQKSDLTLGISNGRRYAGGIDEVIEEFKDSGRIYVRSGEDVFKGLLEMLLLDRVDCIIGYPIEAKYFLKKKLNFDKLENHFIAENNIAYTIGYVGCPKNEWGEEIINSVNQILKEHRQKPEYLYFYEYWLDDQTIPVYKKIVNQYFIDEKL